MAKCCNPNRVSWLIIGTATAMAWALTQSGFSQWLVSIMAGVPGGTAGFLAITIIAFIILGSVLEGLPAIVLFGPLLFPVAKAMGVNESRVSRLKRSCGKSARAAAHAPKKPNRFKVLTFVRIS
jgi:Na+/H+ antiporter NhaD/arsenite permease-like protein